MRDNVTIYSDLAIVLGARYTVNFISQVYHVKSVMVFAVVSLPM